jgi:hypothetical protein
VVPRVSCNTEPRTPNSDSRHLSAPLVWPTPRHLSPSCSIGKSQFGNLRFLIHNSTTLTKPRIPTPQDLAPRVPSPINGSDRFGESQLAISRGVNSYLVNSRTPNLRNPMDLYPSLTVPVGYPPHATPPRSDGPRDFAKLHLDHKSSILFLLRILRLPIFSLVQSLPGLFLRCLQGTIPPELCLYLTPSEISHVLPVLDFQQLSKR